MQVAKRQPRAAQDLITEQKMAITHRREIDGLRALAVLPVIFFHADFQTFRGGFVGVDVFFVISGYLITSIIIAEKHAGTFSLAGFYERRMRRLLPALFLVMLACIPFAWMFMLPDDFENFGQSLVATTFFGNNILLWLTSDYFGLQSQFKPLVHTWSLGIEEQYYLLFPPLLLLLTLWGTRVRQYVLLVLAAVSLGVAQWGSTHAPVSTFYLIHTRGWEFLIGTFVAFYCFGERLKGHAERDVPGKSGQFLSVVGLTLIGYSLFAFDKSTPFPGLHALIPTIGTALVILFADEKTWVGRMLGAKLLVGIGLISYSAYLWSNPLLAFARIASLDEPGLGTYWICIAITFLLALLTWHFVEQPFRRKAFIGAKKVLLLSLVVGGCIASTGWVIHANSGFVHLWPELNSDIKDADRHLNAAYNEKPYALRKTGFGGGKKNNILVLGDSFARDFINAGLENGYFSSSELAYSDSMPTCLGGIRDIDDKLKTLIAQSDYLIVGSPILSLKCWESDFQIFRKAGAKKIIVIGGKNFGWNLNAVMRLPAAERKAYRAKVLAQAWDHNDLLARTLPGDVYVNQLGMLADRERRVPVFTSEGKIISQDKYHLTKEGARFVGKILFEHPLLMPLK